MININENYLKLCETYLFFNIRNKVAHFKHKHPRKKIINLGIGDVTKPLPEVCLKALHKAVEEMGSKKSFRGYGPAEGYDFLRKIISKKEFKDKGINISSDEIFISDGSKSDVANIQELFDIKNKVAIQNPVYPVYIDTNVMAGRTYNYIDSKYQGIYYLDCTEDNNFIPNLPRELVDIIYLCFPNNPTGVSISKNNLKKWVDYALENKSIIIYDAAYESFIQDKISVHSIFEIEGAKKVAIEFRSFSKVAGFTGVRCAYTIISKDCLGYSKNGEEYSIHKLWTRHQSTKFNGVSYIVQKAAEAIYTDEGVYQVKGLVKYYMNNAELISRTLKKLGLKFFGGINSPYIWLLINEDSWNFFTILLEKTGIVCTPGIGFGSNGKNFVRLSSFNFNSKIKLAMKKLVEFWRERRDSNPRPPA